MNKDKLAELAMLASVIERSKFLLNTNPPYIKEIHSNRGLDKIVIELEKCFAEGLKQLNLTANAISISADSGDLVLNAPAVTLHCSPKQLDLFEENDKKQTKKKSGPPRSKR